MVSRQAQKRSVLLLKVVAATIVIAPGLVCSGEEPPPLWGHLRSGAHAVGHRVSFAIDRGRVDLVAPGHPRTTLKQSFRPVMVAVWFPASSADGERTGHEKYFRVPTLAEHPDFSRRLAEFSINAAAQIISGQTYRSLNKDVRDEVDRILATRTSVHENAEPARGPFPVVIYHPGAGGSFDENAVLFEFLASHGYVVISSSYQMGTGYVSNDIGGFGRSLADMRFLLSEAGKLPFADLNRPAAIGHSAGGQYLLQWIGELDCPIRAVVTLDTTLEYTTENFQGHKPLRRSLATLQPPTTPVLLAASAERNPDFRTFDRYLQSAERYEVRVRGLRHDDYVTHGLMRSFSRAGKMTNGERTSLREGYEALCNTVLRFLNAYQKSNERDLAALASTDDNERTVTIRRRAKNK